MTEIKLLKAIEHKVLNEFAERLGVTPEEIIAIDTHSHISDIRHIYCKLRYEKHDVSYSKVGREIKRSHTAVRHAVFRINNLFSIKDKKIEDMWNRVKDIPAHYFEPYKNNY